MSLHVCFDVLPYSLVSLCAMYCTRLMMMNRITPEAASRLYGISVDYSNDTCSEEGYHVEDISLCIYCL